MRTVVVDDERKEKLFLRVPLQIYKGDPVWVCPPNQVISAVFDPRQNPLFAHGEAIRWILMSESGEVLGRIGAFVNRKKTDVMPLPVGGVGFFECINDHQAAALLFDKAKEWLENLGMFGMDGPINFGENDNFWGLLVEGFTHPAFGMNYNPPYYEDLFRYYGFEVYYEQWSSHVDLTKPFPERFWKIADRVIQKPGYRFLSFRYAQREKFAADFAEVYNEAWQFHDGFVPIQASSLLKTLKKSKAILEEELIQYAYSGEEPIGFIVLFPDINQAIKPFMGKMGLFQKLWFVLVSRRKISRARVVILGVKTPFQQMGIESGLLLKLRMFFDRNPRYKEIEISWVGDFNPKMRALQLATGARNAKKHITFRKFFRPGLQVEAPNQIPVNAKELARKMNQGE